MRLHILVEGTSEEAFLNAWLPRFLGSVHSFIVITHQGKGKLPSNAKRLPDPKRRGLLDQLAAKLRAYGKQLQPDTDRVVVLLDVDNDDCEELLRRLKAAEKACKPAPVVLFRLAIEETEAFFLGDAAAIKKAFPNAKIGKLRTHQFDSICGTWEKLRDVIADDSESEDKVFWAEVIAPHLGVKWKGGRGVNKSPSFQKFCEGLKRICGEPTE